MFEGFKFFIVLYSIKDGLNHIEHLVGYENAPTILDTKDEIDQYLDANPVREKAIYLSQMPAEVAKEIFLGKG